MKDKKTSTKPAYLSSNTEIDWNGQSWVERTFSHPERTVRIGTTFSGIGSPEMALKELGVKHEIVFACDINKAAKKSYFANYPITKDQWCDDIRKLDAKKYMGKIDLYVAGLCCQSFSLCGKLKGLDDERGKLFYDFVRVICDSQPKVFIFENVDNIVRIDKGETWKNMLNYLNMKIKEAGLNYQIHFRILNAADYGVPQHRERLFMIGILDEKSNFLFPAPIKLKKSVKNYLDSQKKGVRYLTSRERIRLMGFPDSFKQVVSDNQFSRQAGNSIVVDVMKAIYKQLDITNYGVAA